VAVKAAALHANFDGAAKRFGAVTALDGCSFVARPGRLTGFLGPNGAGKTTAMRAVFGLVELDAGMVRWRGGAHHRCAAGTVRLHARGPRTNVFYVVR
jgi:ABC-type multidrug transport system ATPase subunit